MKKFYAALALALAASPMAMASSLSSTPASQVSLPAEINTIAPVAKAQSDVKKALQVSSVDQLVGVWMFSFYSGFDTDDHNATVMIEKGAGANDIVIYGLFQSATLQCGYGLNASFDASQRTITIPEQVVEPDWGGDALKFIPFNLQTDSRMSSFVLTICPEGITIGDEGAYEDGCIASLGAQGGFFTTDALFTEMRGYACNYNMVFTDVTVYGDESQQFYTYNAADWQDWGYGTYTDGFMNVAEFWGGNTAPYQVKLQKKIGSENEYLILSPYGEYTPYGTVNDASKKFGCIYINANNPECVLVRPGVNPAYDDQSLWPFGPMFFCNNEGNLYYLEEYTIDEVIEEVEFYGDPISKMVVNGDKAVITIENPLVATVCDLYNYTGMFPISGESIMPKVGTLEFSVSGVADMAADASNVAPRYFNLQGIEVQNPAAGELVIVKEGNKTFKKVVR